MRHATSYGDPRATQAPEDVRGRSEPVNARSITLAALAHGAMTAASRRARMGGHRGRRKWY
jgi:hypothetical protein